MTSTLYGHPQSPFVRSVATLLEGFNVEYELKFVYLLKGEHETPEYKKINPQHNIPYYIDGKSGLAINESRAILIYLAQKYDMSKKYYPDCIETQARINQRLYFDANVLWPPIREIIFPIAFEQKRKDDVPPEQFARLKEALGWLNEFVTPTGYLAGTTHPTVADIAAYSCYATVRRTQASLIDLEQFPEANKWEASIREHIKDFDKVMADGLQRFETFYRTRTGLIN